MIKHKFIRSRLSVLVAACLTAGVAPAALADDTTDQMQQMQQQIQTLEQRLEHIQNQQKQDQQAQKATQQKVEQSTAPGQTVSMGAMGNAPSNMQSDQTTMRLGPVNLQLGGFLASETAYRSRSLQSDIGSPYSKIAFAPANGSAVGANNSGTGMGGFYNQSEFRGTERQSRFSLLADSYIDPNTIISGYYELDFLGAAPTANANESNSYQPRTRHVYGNIDWMDTGWHVLAGQTWSLATLNTHGITPRMEEIPLTIDAQYVPGFTWARQWQFRVVKDWDKKWWAAVSLENSQTSGVGGTTPGYDNFQLTPPGGSLFNNLGSAGFNAGMSVNHYPDIIGKLAAETDLGHYEIYDLIRNFQSVYGASATAPGSQQSTWSNAVGFGAVIPLIPKQLELSLSGLFGSGVGRYGTAGLADADFNANGSLNPLQGSQVLGGLTWHVDPKLDLYGNIGEETVDSNVYTNGGATVFGYGNNVTGVSQYAPDLNKVSQETVGMWWAFYKGNYGAAKLGLQYSYTKVTGFQVGGVAPTTNDNMVFSSLRYFPF